MGFLIVPLIIGIIAVPAPAPPPTELANLARIRRALNEEVYLRDASGQERVVSILGVGADTVTVSVGQQWQTMPRDEILAVDRMKDGNRDGFVKGALIGLILGGIIEANVPDSNGRYVLQGAVSYSLIGYVFDRANSSRSKLYRKP